ncbi:MAG: hypothetical protein ACXWMJ_11260 [Syntrophales bacterium]
MAPRHGPCVEMSERITEITQLPHNLRELLIDRYRKMTEVARILLGSEQRKHYYELLKKRPGEDRDVIGYCSLVLALDDQRLRDIAARRVIARKLPEDPENLEKAMLELRDRQQLILREIQARKRSRGRMPKVADTVRIFFDEIKQLREQQRLSWRDLELYMKKQHRKRISFSQLRRLYGEEERRRCG